MALVGEEILQFDHGRQEYITIAGLVHNLDTSRWDQGTQLWWDDINDLDGFTDIPSTDTFFMGTVVESDSVSGIIFIYPKDNG